MFTKAAFAKLVLVPLAAVTLLVQGVAASPTALQLRENNSSASAPSDGSHHWPPPTQGGDRDCRPDCDHLPKVVKPDGNTVWCVGDGQQVVWEKKRPWDDWKDGKDKDGKGKRDGKDGKDKKADENGKDHDNDKKGDKDHGKPRCKSKLTLRKCGGDFHPITLTEDFDLDAGAVGVTVPDVPLDDDYVVTLSLGKLESTSEKFKIVKKPKDCKGCKDGEKDDKDNHRNDNECRDWWCKDHGKDGKDDHGDNHGKDGKDEHGKCNNSP